MKRTERLSSKKYGIMVHYLSSLQNGKHSPNNPLAETTVWDDAVKDFDVEAFVESVHRASAGYVIFTLGQVSAHMCAPSKMFEEITENGCPGACSKRDLPLELGRALERYGIDLYLYFTGDGPRGDEVASKSFETLNHTGGIVTEGFVKNGHALCVSLRFGTARS